ncbi:MAG: tol-pal system protein YbgF [Nitrospirota bacterium]
MEKQKGSFFSKPVNLLSLFFVFWCAGCALQADMIDLQKDMEDIKKGDPALRQQLKETDRALKEKISNLQKAQVDLISKIDRLNSDLEAIRGRLDEDKHRMSEALKKIDDQVYRTKDLFVRMEILEGRSLKGSNTPSKDKGALPDDGKRSGTGRETDQRKAGSDRPDEGGGANPSEVYSQAYSDYVRGNYDLAIMGFQNYIAQYPNANQAQDAHYWVGESFYGKGEYQKAIDAFERFIKRYPRSDKIVTVLLKEGYAHNELGDKANSRQFLNRVISEFSLSEEAKLAKAKLSEIK